MKRRNLKNSAVFGESLRIKILLRHPVKRFNVQIFKLNVGFESGIFRRFLQKFIIIRKIAVFLPSK
jgi:hypothetical protein